MLRAIPDTAWSLRSSYDDRVFLELDDRLLPPGLAIELELVIIDGETWGYWLLSQTGAVLGVVRSGTA